MIMSILLAALCVSASSSVELAAPPAASRPVPTPSQLAWHDLEVGMFIHLGPQTWQDSESDRMNTPLSEINPDRLDTDQWVSVAESMGAKYIVFVAKHEGGFCWWPTATTEYSVKGTPWRGGKGDVMRDLSESCRKHGMKLGVYISPRDLKHGVGIGGRAEDPARQAAYETMFRTQLTELLTNYGPMMEVWFDGSLVFDVGDILARLAPDAVVFQGPQATIRWVGNEDGHAPYPAWNGVKFGAKKWGDYTADDGIAPGRGADRWLPNECDARIRNTWFWRTDNADTLKSLGALMEMYEKSVGRGGVLLLNQTPDRTGRIPEADALRAAEFGAQVARRYGKAVLETSGNGDLLTAQPSAPVTIDAVVTMEDIAQGERISSYAVEGLIDEQWKILAAGSAIGHKKIDRLEKPATVSAVRLRVLESDGEPVIRRLSLHRWRAGNDRSASNVDLGPFLGHVGHDQARIWARASQPGKVQMWMRPVNSAHGPPNVLVAEADAEHDLCVTFKADALKPSTVYLYAISSTMPDSNDRSAWPYSFRTAPDPALPVRVSLAFGSCCKDKPGEALPIFEQIAEAKPEVLVLIGDTPYIDSTDLPVQRKRYREFFGNPQLASLRRSTATYATWDDHDFGRNDTDGRLEGRAGARQAFLEYHANAGADGRGTAAEDGENGRGIYSKFRRGPVEVFLIDARWFSRTEPSPVDSGKPTLLGAQQWEWLRRELKASTATFKILTTGMIWNESVRPLKTDYWGAYKHERSAVWKYIAEAKIDGVVLMGGDIHRSRLLKHPPSFTGAPYPLYEFITSPLHQAVHENAKVDHPSLVWDVGDPAIYLLLAADTTVSPPTLTGRWINAAGTELHRVEIKADELACP